jgi:glycosyltransferase involved in cell wall biosynthesis
MNKILVIAPNYTPGSGPSNALYFLKYVNATKFLFFKQGSSTYYKDMNMYALGIYNLGINHYVLSRFVKSLVEKLRPDYILSIAPELLLSLEEEVLEKTIVIPQGVLESVHIKYEPTSIRAISTYPEIMFVSRRVGGYAAISYYMLRRITEIFHPRKVELIWNPVREAFFELGMKKLQKTTLLNGKRLKLLYVGRLTKLKGVDKLIKFMPEVLREYRDAELHIIGSGPLQSYLTHQVRKLALEDKVFIHGRLPDTELLQHYVDSTLLVTASYWESFCLPVAEAAAAATPSVVREVYALKDHVMLGYAIGFKKDNPENFIEAIGKALDRYEKLALRGFKIAQQLFHPSIVAKKILDLLQSLKMS